ncbi:heme A synthase [Corynebacterium sp. p3-SID1056]|uniref:COX15/CtaA family protein n=1 Tax=Corynebacterium sp. p3-SID1056 TaxID=2916092 RepID=UPI0021A92097|nr:COX15/CtaA family protein [Corynebacterium sp. p3-SID1056]MCT2338862.1 COX15/CtaA family protein [Corynebacterium sp. p3-SID1056]
MAANAGAAGPSIKLQRILAMILLLCQGGITVTGALVRVTGSGLGCDTWPMCHQGSLVPVAGAAPWVHQFIEFGNRLLTFVVAAAAIAVLVAVYRAQRRNVVKALAAVSLAGVAVQAIIGGISVHLDLRWWAVAVHFLPSMILVAVAAALYMRIAEPDDVAPTRMFPRAASNWAIIAAVALAFVLMTGTMVTGSGPHSGDANAGMDGRLEMDTRMLAYVHAFCLYIYLGATAVSVWILRKAQAPKDALRTATVLIVLILVQWAIGVIQFRMGVPRWTIPVHIGMSSMVVAFTTFLWAHGARRVPTLV